MTLIFTADNIMKMEKNDVSLCRLCPPAKVGGHVGFSADPVGVGDGVGVCVSVGVTDSCTTVSLETIPQICLDISLGQA